MRWIAITALLLTAASVPPATDDEKAAAQKAYIECLFDKAKQLDDGISDVLSVAAAIMPRCDPELRVIAEIQVRGQKNSARIALRTLAYLREDQTTAAQVVLMNRKHQR